MDTSLDARTAREQARAVDGPHAADGLRPLGFGPSPAKAIMSLNMYAFSRIG